MVIYGTGIGITQPSIFNRVTVEAPEEIKGLVVAVFNSMKYIGMTLAPLTLKYVYASAGYKSVFITVATLLMLWIIFFVVKGSLSKTPEYSE